MPDAGDLAGVEFWDRFWEGGRPPGAHDPDDMRLDNHLFQLVHGMLVEALEGLPTAPAPLLLEAGCGMSRWLPYFARRFGYRIAGLDYSATGCRGALANVRALGLEADIVEADIHHPPPRFLGSADVVFSAGLVEHFRDTGEAVARLAALAKPGGTVITMVPNLRYLVGFLQGLLDRTPLEAHVLLSREELRRAHVRAGLRVFSAGYVGTINLGIVNLERHRDRAWCPAAKRLLAWASKWYWLLERAGFPSLPNPLTSPVVYCVARKGA